MPAKLNPFTCKPDLVLGPGSGTATVQFDIDSATGPGTDPALPTGAGAITISGDAVAAHSVPIETHSRAANSFNVEVQVGSAVTGAPGDKTAAGIVQFDDTIFTVDADGYVTLVGGGMAIDSFTTDSSGPVGPDGGGNVDVTGTSVFSDGSVANTLTLNVQATANTFLVGAGAASTATELGPLTNGQLIIGSTGVAPVLGSLASADGSITITPGAGTIDLAIAAADDAILTITGDSGGALSPTAGNINILGGSNGIDTSGAGSTLTLNFDVTEQPAIATSVATDSGTATPAANVLTVAGGTGVNTSGSGSTVTVNIDSPVTVANGGTGATSLTDGGILLGSGTAAVTVTAQPTNGQLLMGSTGVDPVLGTLTAPAAGITITEGAGSITFALSDDLAGVEALSSTGLVTRTAANTYTERTITGTANEVDVSNGDGVSGNPTISLPSEIHVDGVSFDSGTNALDEYEEGTFTVTVFGSSTAGSATYGWRNGSYTRIGNTVRATMNMQISAHTGSGVARIDLPFTSANVSNRRHTGSAIYYDGTNYNSYSATQLPNTAYTSFQPVNASYGSGINIASALRLYIVTIVYQV